MNFPRKPLSLRAGMLVLPVLFCASALIGAELRVAAPPVAAVKAINATEMRKHLEFLSSPELGGRYSLAPNFAISGKYLASRLKSYGYKGAGANGSYFQAFDIISTKSDAEKTKLTLTIGKDTLQPQYGEFYNASRFNGSGEGSIVFVGYGISSPSQKHDDYAGLDVKGKIVLIAGGEPKGLDSSNLAENESDEGAARAHGAVGVLRVPTAQYVRAMKNPTYKENSLRFASNRLGAEKADKLPIIRLSPELADKLLAQNGTTVEKLNETTKAGDALTPKALDASAKMTAAVIDTKMTTQNVVAILPGKDAKLRDEYVTFSAHYDHLNTNAKGEIYPGADDDGSGTTAVLNIAQAMAMQPPKRSVFIIFHAGEELGLLGSKYNTDYSPAVPLEKMVVDLNIDMIGRSRAAGDTEKANAALTGPDTIYVIGADRISKELHRIHEATNAKTVKLKFDYTMNDTKHPEKIYFRSDHWNYAKHGVPIIFYFDGIHVDYHKPTDTIDKIDFEKMTKVTRLVYETGWNLANMTNRPKKD
ncbi:MAG TPA: M28 family peptidase [Terriglobales bacterium]|nr:M28 family peptidase [Terriglobales bacterium]